MDANLADVARFAQPDVAPASAGVGTAIDAVAVGDVDANGGLASAGVDDVRVRRRHGQGPDRGGGEEAIGHGPPVCSRIGRFPDAAGDGAEIEGVGIMPCAGYGNDPATPERSDAAPPEQPLEIVLLQLRHRLCAVSAPQPQSRVLPSWQAGLVVGQPSPVLPQEVDAWRAQGRSRSRRGDSSARPTFRP